MTRPAEEDIWSKGNCFRSSPPYSGGFDQVNGGPGASTWGWGVGMFQLGLQIMPPQGAPCSQHRGRAQSRPRMVFIAFRVQFLPVGLEILASCCTPVCVDGGHPTRKSVDLVIAIRCVGLLRAVLVVLTSLGKDSMRTAFRGDHGECSQ